MTEQDVAEDRSALGRASALKVRSELEEMLVANILGPESGPSEALPTQFAVRDYYLVGMLAPKQVPPDPGELDESGETGLAQGEESEAEPLVPAAPMLFPSSLGMTFAVDGACTQIRLSASWGRYERERRDDEEDERKRSVWARSPAGGERLLDLAEGTFELEPPDASQPGVKLRGRVRQNADDWVVTVFLVNDQIEPKQDRDEAWLFQVELQADDLKGGAVFRQRRPEVAIDESPETQALDMAYRSHVEFVMGHGTGVHAEVDPGDPRRARAVKTVAVPVYEVPRTDAPTASDVSDLEDVVLDMRVLAETASAELPGVLEPLVVGYRKWIEQQRGRISDPTAMLDGYEATAGQVLDACEHMTGRIEAGIEIMRADESVADAFRFANRAMWLQRVHTDAAELRRKDPSLSPDDALGASDRAERRSWRPFQLAFLLVNLPSLADPKHVERGAAPNGLVDLLWFPTGGGKTEAYLGLTAFTLAMRRLQGIVGIHDGSDGVGVLMRYTLRLLTVQQFQRAAALICACERIRGDAAAEGDDRWGAVPFRLGLWVGYHVTPGKGDEAAKAIDAARGAAWHSTGASPVQIKSCPWCGSPVDIARDAERDAVRKRTLVYCGDPLGRCEFSRRKAPGEGLPMLTVDDEIYRFPPSMVIATADKFAQMPWQGPTRALFGRVTHRCERHGYRHPDLDEELDERETHNKKGDHPAARTVPVDPLRPPDLIIQDELHLIAGPLGSVMGLYETAVDALCTWELDGVAVRPKVVASTATVRRAELQAYQVFERRLEVFPPPGLDASDSFFALQRGVTESPGRRYLGVCAPGRRIKAVEIRLYTALMGAAQKLFDRYGEAVDPWMTLVGYFGALRELAGMSRLVDDDVWTRLSQKAMLDRGLAQRFLRSKVELTSRIDSSEIPTILEQLMVPFVPGAGDDGGDGDGGKRRRRKRDEAPHPVDILLATNMLSVGVDIPRLGLMVVGGQPKSTAEYIQTTSRVGRSAEGPGLVVTALNWARPRDLSHYETFEHFHATFYRHVEAVTVTPFAPRALDRGLAGVLAAIVRQRDDATNANPAPQTIDLGAESAEAVDAIVRRAEEVTGRNSVGADVRTALAAKLDVWKQRQATGGSVLGYRERKDGKTVGLLSRPGSGRWSPWTVPNSLREVEPGVNLLLVDGPEPQQPEFVFPAPDGDATTETTTP